VTRSRWVIAGVMVAALLLLVGWQIQRQRAITVCDEAGGIWDGANSRCLPKPPSPILQRDIYRS
jgi:hypothetical protein